jgi:hypothetical protein
MLFLHQTKTLFLAEWLSPTKLSRTFQKTYQTFIFMVNIVVIDATYIEFPKNTRLVCLFVFTRPGGTHDRCFQPVTRFLPSFGPEPTEGSHKATRQAARGRQDQFLTMRCNTGLTAAPASPLYGSPVCKRSPIQVLTVLNVA